MQIIEINEPEKSNLLDQIVVGIDFGTTNSLVAYSKNHSPQILKILGDQDLLPSVISYDDQHDIFLVGKNRDDKGSISSIKRLLAKSHYDIQSTKSLQKILSGFDIYISIYIYIYSYVPAILFHEGRGKDSCLGCALGFLI